MRRALRCASALQLCGYARLNCPFLVLLQIAAACCRLSTAWLWMTQLEAVQAALKRDPTAVAAALEDPAAVDALLPCVAPQGAAAGKPAGVAPVQQALADQQAPAASGVEAAQPAQQQQQQEGEAEEEEQQDGPAAKRPCTDGLDQAVPAFGAGASPEGLQWMPPGGALEELVMKTACSALKKGGHDAHCNVGELGSKLKHRKRPVCC